MRGHIHKRVRTNRAGKTSVLWYVVVDAGRDAEGRRRQKWHGGFATRREAEVARAKLVNDLHTGSYVTPDRMTLDAWVRESWLPTIESQVKPSTFDSYRRSMALHVLPVIGARPLQQLTAAAGVVAERLLLDDGSELLNMSTMRHSEDVIRRIASFERGKEPISYRRLDPIEARTIIAGHRALPVHPELNRTISVREAAVVQGFPLDYFFAVLEQTSLYRSPTLCRLH